MAPPLSRGELRQLHRAVKPALARLIRPVDVPQAAGLAGIELDGLPRHALRQVAHLEGGDEAAGAQALHVEGVAEEVHITDIVDVAVDVGIAVVHGAAVRVLHSFGQADPGQGALLAERAAVGALELRDPAHAGQLVGSGVGQHPGGHRLPHRLSIHKQVEVPVGGGSPPAPVPGADVYRVPPAQRDIQPVPQPGQHPEAVVPLQHLVPGDVKGTGRLGGGLLEHPHQPGGAAVVPGVDVPGVHHVLALVYHHASASSVLAVDDQLVFTADVVDVAGGGRRNAHGPAAVGAEQVDGAEIDLELPAVGAAGAGDAVPLGDLLELGEHLLHHQLVQEGPLLP